MKARKLSVAKRSLRALIMPGNDRLPQAGGVPPQVSPPKIETGNASCSPPRAEEFCSSEKRQINPMNPSANKKRRRIAPPPEVGIENLNL